MGNSRLDVKEEIINFVHPLATVLSLQEFFHLNLVKLKTSTETVD